MYLGWDWAAVGSAVVDLLDLEAAKSVTDLAVHEGVGRAKSLWTKVKWVNAEETYRQRLLPFVSTTRLLGNPKPVNIDRLYTDLFLYDKMSALRRAENLLDPRADANLLLEDRERKKARDVVATGENLYLLGHPGAGKTTFLRYLAILCCKGILKQVPVYLQLRDVARSYTPLAPGTSVEEVQRGLRALIFDSIVNEFEVCSFPDPRAFVQSLFKKGDALVLLDGLDEVASTDGLRVAFIDSVRDLERRFPEIQICVTCRIAASEYTFETFSYAEVAHFTEEQQRSFIDRWYADDPLKRARIVESWALPRSRPLHDLGRTPLLLALICLAFDDLNELPDRHVDLYREALEALLKRWDSSRSIFRDAFYAGLNPHRREQLLQEIAADLLQRDKIIFSADEVRPIAERWFSRLPEGAAPNRGALPTNDFLDQIEAQHGLLIQRARGVYSFAHLSIQEFLCAKSIAEGHAERALEAVAQRHVFDPRWREVLVFCAGLLQDGTRLLELLVKAANQALTTSGELVALLAQVGAEYHGGQHRRASPSYLHGLGASRSAYTLGTELVGRLDSLPWAGPDHPLRAKVVILCELLSDVEFSNKHLSLIRDGSLLPKYLQAVSLIVDCACVATCLGRDRIISPLLTNNRF
jgi:predicted NACHT family NTPase